MSETAHVLQGHAHVLGDDINTDYIISGRYKFKTLDRDVLAQHLLEDLIPDFYSRITPGDFIVAGENFGCGSSREQAPLAIKYAGISAVVASSFARIFYRNAINLGLPIVITDTSDITEHDELRIDLTRGRVTHLRSGTVLETAPFPPQIMQIIEAGGLAAYFRQHGGWSSIRS